MSALATSVASSAASASLSLSDAQFPGEKKEKKGGAGGGKPLFILLSLGLAAGTAVSGVIAMTMHSVAIIYAAFGVGIANSVYVPVQRYQLFKMQTLREVMNKLRVQINRTRVINNELADQNDELKVRVDKLKEVEEGLSNIVTKQGRSVEKFVAAVKENQKTLDGMKELVKAQVLQNLVSIVLRADVDGDNHIDPHEVNMMLMFLRNAPGVMLDEKKFLAKMHQEGNSLPSVLAICKQLVRGDERDEQIIDVDPKQVNLCDLDDLDVM